MKMYENSYQKLRELISEMDKLFNKGKLILIKANNYDYVISGYKVVGSYIMLYFGKDLLDSYHYSDIQEIKELM